MRLMLYNMRYATGTGFKFHLPVPFGGFFRRTNKNLDALIQFFREQKADVLGLVEVDDGSYRTGHRSQAEAIARQLGKRTFCRTKYSYQSWWSRLPIMRKQANACLSGPAVLRERTHFLRKGMKRLVMELELEDVIIYIVHLAVGRRCREAQLADLARLVKRSRKPYLIAGDFNAFAGRIELQSFMQELRLASANYANLPTFPSQSPRWQLDFILHSPEIRVTRFEVARHVQLSDHLPLICDFEVRAQAKAASA
ncbi:MAG TPA: endonuclease/exonuclease/phosphatase family protein [Kiritimatiellia bacterium]|nr:endonuclease/exonuclease/phosphatase family protein [Kiritimatiellia bacterium]HOE00727.1 endonuclease/exonuclease/phosphatase family protein [Kiritimatiellia bacterium]HOE37485.1 endonuclease/exonuclease/phosphatase family protein [Kiritimatiellia bacterium]HOR74740.1 endonuclease/exonuclease/phosphatase family protein [Kiritimatiellia bacterium]HOU59473.1 endonuclease/exonuclease/phosphatase family protein [Kiritimatiellia bacterium]